MQTTLDELANFYDRIYASFQGSELFQLALQEVFVEDYLPSLENFSFVRNSDIHRIKESFQEIHHDSILLELGCGTGGLLHYLAKEYPCLLVGIDISPNAIRYASHQKSNSVSFTLADMSQLPFSACSIDGIFSIDAIHHAEPYSLIASDIVRVLKPGGKLNFSHWANRKACLKYPRLDPLYQALLKRGLILLNLSEVDPGLFMQLRVYAAIHERRERVIDELGNEVYHLLMNEARYMWNHAGKVSRVMATFAKPI